MAKQQIEKIQPSLDSLKAIDLINKQAAKIDEIIELDYRDPKVNSWESFTEQLLVHSFGKPHDNLIKFSYTLNSGGPIIMGMSDREWQENYVKSMENMKELLLSFAEQLELFSPVLHLDRNSEEKKQPIIQNFYITQSQAQRIENTINIEEQPTEVKERVEELLSELKKEKTKDKSKISEIIKWLADRSIDVLIAILTKS